MLFPHHVLPFYIMQDKEFDFYLIQIQIISRHVLTSPFGFKDNTLSSHKLWPKHHMLFQFHTIFFQHIILCYCAGHCLFGIRSISVPGFAQTLTSHFHITFANKSPMNGQDKLKFVNIYKYF